LDDDYLPFWQTLRATHHDLEGRFCFAVAGTNARCCEVPIVRGQDNPIFQGVSPQYLQPFAVSDVAEMSKIIGKYMGLTFEPEVFPYLEQRFGGHPFLIRKACSRLAEAVGPQRPSTISPSLCDREDARLLDAVEPNVAQLLTMLARWYPDEYAALS